MLVCAACFDTSKTIIEHIDEEGRSADCPTCGSKSVKVIEAVELKTLFDGLKQLYVPAERGVHYVMDDEDREKVVMGDQGDDLLSVLQDNWPIFSDKLDEEQIREILNEVWPEHDECLYTSEELWDRDPDGEWDQIKYEITHVRRFFSDHTDFDILELPTLLGPHLERFSELLKPSTWIRARMGKNWKADEMGAPPPQMATAGRANPAGISYWYLASDTGTALAEVRAEPGDYVRIATVKLDNAVYVLNLARSWGVLDPFAYQDIRAEINARKLLSAFQKDLSKPVRFEDHPIDYVPTQYLAEFFASRGFDGIHYPSSVAAGTNLVLFVKEKANVLDVTTVQVVRKTLEFHETLPIQPSPVPDQPAAGFDAGIR